MLAVRCVAQIIDSLLTADYEHNILGFVSIYIYMYMLIKPIIYTYMYRIHIYIIIYIYIYQTDMSEDHRRHRRM